MPSSVHNSQQNRAFPGSSFRYTPLEHVRVLFVSFVQGLFAAAPAGQFRWHPEEELTEIIIRDENPIHVDTAGKRPAINFTIGPTQFYHVGMDDLVDFQFDTARKEKGVLVPGTMSINVCSRVDIEAHNLAWVVAEHIWLLRELFLQRGFFELGRGITISPPSAPGSIVASDQADEWFCSTVSVPWQFARKSAFTPLGQRIVQSIVQNINVNPQKLIESKGVPGGAFSGQGHEYPWHVTECAPPSFAPLASDAGGGTPDPGGVKSNPLPTQPHPLNPAKTVVVKVVRPNRSGLRRSSAGRGAALPIGATCVEKSGGES